MDLGIFRGRLDLGFGNPNKTAALLAVLAVGVWLFKDLRRGGFWISFILSGIFSGLLILTHSRGGLISVAAGFLVLALFSPRPWSRKRLIAIFIGLLSLTAFSVWQGAAHRYVQGLVEEDLSISNRLAIWRNVPQMIVDAPQGWGVGNSGAAFMQWYQTIDRHETYRTLVSSHLTWLTEFNWPLRILYVFAWAAALLLCWPRKENPFSVAIGFAVWIAFFISASFSSVAESIYLWIVPGAWLLGIVGIRIRDQSWLEARYWSLPVLASFLFPLAILGFFELSGSRHIVRFDGTQTILGNGDPDTCIVHPDPFVIEDRYGQALRKARPHSTIAVAQDDKRIQASPSVVYMGGSRPTFLKPQKDTALILLNPTWNPQALDQEFIDDESIRVYCGEFYGKAKSAEWEALGETHSNIKVTILAGCGEFIPNWIELVTGAAAQP